MNDNVTYVIYMLRHQCGMAWVDQALRVLKLHIMDPKATIQHKKEEKAVGYHCTKLTTDIFCSQYCGDCYQTVPSQCCCPVRNMGVLWNMGLLSGGLCSWRALWKPYLWTGTYHAQTKCSWQAVEANSNLAVPGLPWGISSMLPIETPNAT